MGNIDSSSASFVHVLRVSGPNGQGYGAFVWPDSGHVSTPEHCINGCEDSCGCIWNERPDCGNGLHGWESGIGDGSLSKFIGEDGAKWQIVRVLDAPNNLVRLDGKVKFRSGEVVHTGDQKTANQFLVDHDGERAGRIGGTATAGDSGTATAGDSGTATAGYSGTATAGNRGTATAGDDGCIRIAWWDGDSSKYRTKTAIPGDTKDVNGNAVMGNIPYRLDSNHCFEKVPATERFVVVHGNIVDECTDVIVNAANETLLGGGGVDGAIHAAAGTELLAACRNLSGCPTGSAKYTRGFKLRARHIIHAVGPKYDQDGAFELLARCYRAIISAAIELKAVTISIPAISTGAFGYPVDEATKIAIEVIASLIVDTRIRWVRFVCFDEQTADVYRSEIATLKNVA